MLSASPSKSRTLPMQSDRYGDELHAYLGFALDIQHDNAPPLEVVPDDSE
ncbi:hypothetical protein TRAPUB_9857 [Trametes pubescens]|uniref:Uncharacterized protein n=1 Tax=Trametes pubescens TaxID=154538 RepID=A0A1M2W1E6_TRAPU|nr:hypothetical protein TRAPUB_9857 [Trametes pubescens]